MLTTVVAGLFWAKLITDHRSRLIVGAGITLPGSGLTVQLPQQSDWRSLSQWLYERTNSFVLPARLQGPSHPLMDISWRYKLNAAAQTSRQILEQIAGQLDGQLFQLERTVGSCPMEYSKILTADRDMDLYIGVAVLDFGRILILQVNADIDSPYSADVVFKRLADGILYEKPAELIRGEELLQKLRQYETTALLAEIGQQNLLARDASGSVRGYETIQANVDGRGRVQINKTVVSRVGRINRQKEHLLESVHPFEIFDWRCENDSFSEIPGIVSLRLGNDGELTIEDPTGRKQNCKTGPVVVSELLLDIIVRFFLEAEQPDVVLDVLYDDGRILPTHICTIPLAQAQAKAREMAFAVRLESPTGTATEFYFAADKSPLGKMTTDANHKAILWEVVDQADIKKQFHIPTTQKGPVVLLQSQYIW